MRPALDRLLVSISLTSVAVACSGTAPDASTSSTGSGGAAVTGGSSAVRGGNATTGGSTPAAGGATVQNTGGQVTTGGVAAGGTTSGGKAFGGTAAGGLATGGAGTGGLAAGGVATGGKATGGQPTQSGGAGSGGMSAGGNATGGNKATGGATATGGAVSTGGTLGSGGTTGTCGGALNPNPFGCKFAWGLADFGGSLAAYSYLQFMTIWIETGLKADGTFTTCSGCTWLKNSIAPTNLIPVYYAYLIGFLGHANGLVDGNQCPASNPDCPNLTTGGAALIKSKRSQLIQAYAEYAKQSYAAWPTKPLVWLLEGDFMQYNDAGQSSPLTLSELALLAKDITCAIKGNMPNAVVALNHTVWNSNQETDDFWNAMKSAGVNYDMAWTTGVANNSGYISAGTGASTYNGATAKYSYIHQLTGKTIFVDDGCGAETNEDWSRSPASVVNSLIASGVVAFNHCGHLQSTYQSLIGSLTPQLSSTCQ